eukprot:1425832-Pyramimonas_sp.AAC.1
MVGFLSGETMVAYPRMAAAGPTRLEAAGGAGGATPEGRGQQGLEGEEAREMLGVTEGGRGQGKRKQRGARARR